MRAERAPEREEIMQVRASNGRRFFLQKDRMGEDKKQKTGYFLFRADLKRALKSGHTVAYGFADLLIQGFPPALEKYPTEGVTQRNKKYISIGCMRFVGQERIKLLKWAKA